MSQQSCGSLYDEFQLLTNTLDIVTFYDLSEQTRDSPVSIYHLLKTPVLKLQQLLYLDRFSYIIPGDLWCFMLFSYTWEEEYLYGDKAPLCGYS